MNNYSPIIYYTIAIVEPDDSVKDLETIQSEKKARSAIKAYRELNPKKTFLLIRLTEEVIE